MRKPAKMKTNFEVVKYVFKFCPGFIYFAILHIISSVIKSLSRVLLITNAIEVVIQNQNINDIYALLDSILIYIIIIIICSIILPYSNKYILSALTVVVNR